MKTIIISILILTLFGCTSTQHLSSQNDPCKDKILLQLEQKDSLSVDEMKLYTELKSLCNDRRNTEKIAGQLKDISDAVWLQSFMTVILVSIGIAWAIIE